MARETAAERDLRIQAEEDASREQRRIAYPDKFRRVLSAALMQNMQLTKVDYVTGEYTVYDRDEDENYIIWDTFGNHPQSEWPLERLENRIVEKVYAAVEAARKRELRTSAWAKLNAEERKVLGL